MHETTWQFICGGLFGCGITVSGSYLIDRFSHSYDPHKPIWRRLFRCDQSDQHTDSELH